MVETAEVSQEIFDLVQAHDRYREDPTFENFTKLVELVKVEHHRGAVNRDNQGHGFAYARLNSDEFNLALVCRGIKPVAWIYKLPPIFEMLGLEVIKMNNLQSNLDDYLVFREENWSRALDVQGHIISSSLFAGSWFANHQDSDRYERRLGELLGYPSDDVEYYLEKNRINRQLRIPFVHPTFFKLMVSSE